MKIPQLKPEYKHFEKISVVQLALLKKFCALNKIKISDKKLFYFFKQNKFGRTEDGY